MSGQIICFGATGNPLNYYQVRSLTTGQIANGTALEVYNQAHWGNYTVAATEQAGSGGYVASIPGYLPADLYKAVLYTPVGGSPASGDTPISDSIFGWDGGNILGPGSAVNVGQINGSAQAAIQLALSANEYGVGAAAAGTLTTTTMTTNLTATVANIYAGRVLLFTRGVNSGLAVLVTAYAVTGGLITFIAYNNNPAPAAPSAGDSFLIL
jgi:hypothetical protein